MKASELRIGNFVFDSDRENPYYYTVEKIQSREYSESAEEEQDEIIGRIDGSIDGFYDIIPSPIPLTEEWLLKFGFEFTDWLGSWDLKDGNFGLVKTHNEKFVLENHSISPEIQYVNQLQNLYFALTGSELEIKW